MQAYMKNGKLIINTMIDDRDKSEFIEFIQNTEFNKLQHSKLYDINGDVSGISFELN